MALLLLFSALPPVYVEQSAPAGEGEKDDRLRLLKAILVIGLLAATPSVASAAIFTPSPADLQDLQHQTAWNIGGESIKTANVTPASLVFKNLYHSTTSANELFIHLFNSLNLSGSKLPTPTDADRSSSADPSSVYRFADTTSTTINDGYTISPSWVVGNLLLTQSSFPGPVHAPDTTTGSSNPAYNYSYTFSAGESAALNTYIDDGWIALGLDADYHFYNDGVSLNMSASPSIPTPEPASLILIGSGLAGLRAFQRRRRARAS